MRCPDCKLVLKFKDTPDIDACTLCGQPMIPDAIDILQDGMYGIAREVRPTQVKLARDVEKVLRRKDGGTLMAEGGTGIGKSFAYLIPALLQPRAGRIVISTAKKALQHQLAGSPGKQGDIPFLLERMNVRRKFALYKGNGNYACWRLEAEVPKGAERDAYRAFVNICRNQHQPADLANWVGSKPSWWDKVTVDNCVQQNKCVHEPYCKVRPKDYDVLVVNHHILSIDLRGPDGMPGMILGSYDTLIIDEAHNMPDAYRSVHTQSIGSDSVPRLRRKLDRDQFLQGFIDDSEVTTTKLVITKFEALSSAVKSMLKVAATSTNGNGVIANPGKFIKELDILTDAGGDLYTTLTRVDERGAAMYADGDDDANRILAMRARLKRMKRGVNRISKLVTELKNEAYGPDEEPLGKFLILFNEDGLHAKPLMVGELMGPSLKRISRKVITSATLANGTDFSHALSQFGIPEADERIYESPFDFKKQSVLYVPTDIIPPQHNGSYRRDDWINEVSEEIFKLSYAVDGNTFVLFSSRKDMEEVEQATAGRMRSAGLNLVVQGDNYAFTLNEYMSNPKSVLYGLKSFWEGVDIQGDKLRAVIIPKLPFPYVGDPIMEALKKKMGSKFFPDIYVPMMLIDLKQGVGRLIRSKTDKGLLAILDPRAWTGSSGKHDNILPKVKRALEEGHGVKRASWGYGQKVLSDLKQVNVTNDFTIAVSFAKQLFTDVNHAE
jgi:ATP-dependent DNA helicase DinG